MEQYSGNDFKEACDSVRGEELYSILIELDIPMKLVRVIGMCLNKICSNVCIAKSLPDAVPVQSGLKQGDALL